MKLNNRLEFVSVPPQSVVCHTGRKMYSNLKSSSLSEKLLKSKHLKVHKILVSYTGR